MNPTQREEELLGSQILDVAEYCGQMEHLQLWWLRKAIPGHPKGSTVTRDILRRHFARCSVVVEPSDPAISSVEMGWVPARVDR